MRDHDIEDGLIDLGAVTAETKGENGQEDDTDNQERLQPGALSVD